MILVVTNLVTLSTYEGTCLPLVRVIYRDPCCFSDILEESYMGLYFAFICATPTVLITTAYLKIFLLARSQARRITSLRMYIEELSTYNGGPMNSPRPIRFARESKAAKTIGKVQKSVFYEFSFFLVNLRVFWGAFR